jgi:hypothetical protein
MSFNWFLPSGFPTKTNNVHHIAVYEVQTKLAIISEIGMEPNSLALCGDGFMDFIHRPENKILKILKNSNHNVSEAGSASV